MRGDQEQVKWADKTSSSKGKDIHLQLKVIINKKELTGMSIIIVELSQVTLENSIAQLYLNKCVGTVVKKGMLRGRAQENPIMLTQWIDLGLIASHLTLLYTSVEELSSHRLGRPS